MNWRNKILKLLLLLIAGLFLLELLLNLYAVHHNRLDSFDMFLRGIPTKIAAAKKSQTIYFVGDSTMYGFGVKEPERYSLPAQLEQLLQQNNLDVSCLNLGRINTGPEEHLRVLSLLPKGATVIYRGGLIYVRHMDSQKNGFFFTLAGYLFESRILKMLFLLYPNLLPRNTSDEQKISHDFQSIAHRLKLKVISIDYTTYPESVIPPVFFLEKDTLPNIPLRQEFTKAGFMKEDGTFQDQYVSFSGTHPNEIGHYLEAIAVYNYFCREQWLGLSPQKQLANTATQQITKHLQAKYLELKQRIATLTIAELAGQNRRQYRNLVYDLWFYAGLLLNIIPDENIKLELEAAKQIGLFVFHDPRIAWMMLASNKKGLTNKREIFAQWFPQSEKDKKIYRDILWATTAPDTDQYQRLKFMTAEYRDEQGSYVGDIYPFPLEFCPMFLQDSKANRNSIASQSAWEHFFDIPYNYFSTINIVGCQNH